MRGNGALCFLFLFGVTAGYEYSPQRERNYRYTNSDSSNSWTYSGNSGRLQNVQPRSNNNLDSRSNTASRDSFRNSARPHRFDNSQLRSYPQTFNEVDGPLPVKRNRWYSPAKRQTGGLRLDQHNRVQMGVSNSECDDAKTNLRADWDLSPINYTCYHPETRFPRNFDADAVTECDRLHPRYVPGHVCMDEGIEYKDLIPTHGDHRPLWPKFGEYQFVPRERWLHNIEHGAIVMLYHPCAYPSEVNRLRTIVRSCVGKHVITPSTFLPPERPLALVAWGCRLLMSAVDDELAINFITTRAHRGPEGTYQKEGQYELALLRSAKSSGNGAKYGYSRVTCDTLDRSRL